MYYDLVELLVRQSRDPIVYSHSPSQITSPRDELDNREKDTWRTIPGPATPGQLQAAAYLCAFVRVHKQSASTVRC